MMPIPARSSRLPLGLMGRDSGTLATQTETGKSSWSGPISTSLLAEGLLVVAGYILCFWVGTAFILESGVSVVWPPSGFVLAVLLRLGMRAIVPVWIGAALANLIWSATPPIISALLPALTVSEALIGILLLRLVGFDSALRRLRDIAALVAVGAPISTLLNALAALYVMNAIGITSWTDYWHNVLLFWGGNTGGILTIAPGFLILTNRGEQGISTESWIEAGLLTLLAFAA